METDEKVRIMMAAVQVAAANGFDFQEWYQNQLNICSSNKIPIKTRIDHMCYLGFESVLIFDHEFSKALVGEPYLDFLQKLVVQEVPLDYLKTHLILIGEWDDGLLTKMNQAGFHLTKKNQC